MINTRNDSVSKYMIHNKHCIMWAICIWAHAGNHVAGLILGLHPANERRRYFVSTSLIGWTQT